jgi:serine/threonine-protein kinase
LYFHLNQRDEARQAWEKSLRIRPSYPAYANLGASAQMEEDYPAAAAFYEKALALDDHDYQVWTNLAATLNQVPGNEQKAAAAYAQAIRLAEERRMVNPRDPLLLAHLADCYAMIGDSTRAVSTARQALALAPENVLILARTGLVFEVVGDRKQALACLGGALQRGFPLADLEHFPELDQLRMDGRFSELVRHMSLEDTVAADALPPVGEDK